MKVNMSGVQKVTFAWASGIIGAVGVAKLAEGNYSLGIVFMLVALALELARELLKRYGVEIKK